MFKNNLHKGFTFIELLVVISIIITILVLSVPAILSYQKKQAESEEIRNFISSFRSAQNLALTTDSTYSLAFSNGDVSICRFGTTECKKISNEYLISPVATIYIDKYGNLSDQNNNIISQKEIILTSTSYKLIINKFGRIYAQDK